MGSAKTVNELETTAQHRTLRLSAIRSTTAAAAVAKVITAVVQLALVPITLSYLGQSLYGVWMVISATVAFLQVSDLGIGNALISLTAQQRIAGGATAVIRLLKKALVISGVVASVLWCMSYVAVDRLSWVEWLGIPLDQQADAHGAIIACLTMFCVSMPLSLAQQIRLGLMQGYGNSIFQAVGQLLNLLFVWLGVQAGASLAAIVVLSALGILLANSCNLLMLLTRYRGLKAAPALSRHDSELTFKAVFARGMPFLILQLAGLFASQADVVVISHFLGPDKVTDYSVSMKFFSVPVLILAFYLYSVWPAYADAEARGDWAWIRDFFSGSIKKSLLFSVAMSMCFLMGSFWILPWWTGGKIDADPLLVVLLAFFVGLNALGGNLASFMNGLHMLRLQSFLAVLGAITTLVISVGLTPRIGLSGPVAAMVFTNTIMYGIMFWSVQKKLRSSLAQQSCTN